MADLESLPDSAVFVLRAVLQLDWARPVDVCAATMLTPAEVANTLRYGRPAATSSGSRIATGSLGPGSGPSAAFCSADTCLRPPRGAHEALRTKLLAPRSCGLPWLVGSPLPTVVVGLASLRRMARISRRSRVWCVGAGSSSPCSWSSARSWHCASCRPRPSDSAVDSPRAAWCSRRSSPSYASASTSRRPPSSSA